MHLKSACYSETARIYILTRVSLPPYLSFINKQYNCKSMEPVRDNIDYEPFHIKYHGNQDYVVMLPNGNWMDIPCTLFGRFFCSKDNVNVFAIATKTGFNFIINIKGPSCERTTSKNFIPSLVALTQQIKNIKF